MYRSLLQVLVISVTPEQSLWTDLVDKPDGQTWWTDPAVSGELGPRRTEFAWQQRRARSRPTPTGIGRGRDILYRSLLQVLVIAVVTERFLYK
ncbi:MAG TPA: hypothetical protein VFZ76_09715 [Anaerolineales bacterium]